MLRTTLMATFSINSKMPLSVNSFQDPTIFFKAMKDDTWIDYWDNMCGGFISQNTIHALSKKVGILGPTAAIFGRDFELFIVSEWRLCTCPVEKLEESIRNTSGTLSKECLDPYPIGVPNWGKTLELPRREPAMAWPRPVKHGAVLGLRSQQDSGVIYRCMMR